MRGATEFLLSTLWCRRYMRFLECAMGLGFCFYIVVGWIERAE